MPQHLTGNARSWIPHALRRARHYISREHLLVTLMSAVSRGPARPARVVLHSCRATTEDVSDEIARRAGPGAVLFGGLDREALAAIGIDLDAVRARIESSFGPEALQQAAHRNPRPSGLKGRPSKLLQLKRAHPDTFDDALRAVITRAKTRKP